MISAQVIFKPGTYDEDSHRLDAKIEAYVATIPGFLGAENWVSFDGQTEKKLIKRSILPKDNPHDLRFRVISNLKTYWVAKATMTNTYRHLRGVLSL